VKRLVEFELKDGSPVYVEVEEEIPAGFQKTKRGDEDKEEPKKAGPFKDALDRIKPAAEMVVDAFREFNRPDEIAVEFALKVSGKANVFVFSSDTEATFKVVLKWANRT